MITLLPLRLANIFKSLACASLIALPSAPLRADDLPFVPGVVLLHANEAQTCVSGSASAPLFDVLERIQRDQKDLRAVSMAWSDIIPLIAAEDDILLFEPDTNALAPDENSDAPQPTVHLFPDNRIYEEIAACGDPSLNEAPKVQGAPGRIWALNVTGSPIRPEIELPDAWQNYALEAAASESTLTTCLLMGGALPRQPATAARVAKMVEGSITESLEGAPPKTHLHSTRLASGLFHPGALRMRGWDLVLLAGLSENDVASDTTCDEMMAQYLQEDDATPVLGPDPQGAFLSCPAEGLQPGETLRQQLSFVEGEENFQFDPTDLFAEFESCAIRSRENGPNLSVTIEAYGSVDGGSQENWEISQSRARAVLDTLNPLGIPTASGGFGESAMFADDNQGNRVAFITLTAGPILSPGNGSLDSALLRRYLEPNGTCNALQSNLTGELLPFLASPFGTELLEALQTPDFVLVFQCERHDWLRSRAAVFCTVEPILPRQPRKNTCGLSL